MLKRKQNVPAVQSTNDCSVLSKCSMISQGYFDDELLLCFVNKVSRRSPLINRGYYIRAKAVERTFQVFLHYVKECVQVLSLGAGYDCTYFRLASKNIFPNDAVYFEVDFPEVVQKKKNIILNNECLLKLVDPQASTLSSSCVIDSARYKLMGADLQQTKALQTLLQETGFSVNKPTLILSECVTVYMHPHSCADLLSWAAQEMEHAVFASYEQINPEDGFGLVMVNHFHSVGSPLRSISAFSTKYLQWQRFISLGWKECTLMDMNEIYDTIVDWKEKEKVDSLEPFDEFEEWHLKCSHYVMVWAAVGSCAAFVKKFCPVQPIFSSFKPPSGTHISSLQYRYFPDDGKISRFGHASWATGQYVFSSGGFGDEDGCHKRLEKLCVTDLLTGHNTEVPPEGKYVLGSQMFHTSTLLSNGMVILIGGRSSPKRASPLLLTLVLSPELGELGQTTVSDRWKYRAEEITHSSGVVPCRRWRHSASTVSLSGIEHVFIFGGRTAEDKCLNDCYLLNTQTFFWKEVLPTSEAPVGRHSHSCNNFGGDIVVACGLEQGEVPSSSIHLFNTTSLIWSQIIVAGLLPRYSHSCHVIQNKLVLIGGVNKLADYPPGVAVVDLVMKCASELKFTISNPQSPIMLHNHTSVVTGDEDIIVLGGGGNCFSFGTHFNQGFIKIPVTNLLQSGSTHST